MTNTKNNSQGMDVLIDTLTRKVGRTIQDNKLRPELPKAEMIEIDKNVKNTMDYVLEFYIKELPSRVNAHESMKSHGTYYAGYAGELLNHQRQLIQDVIKWRAGSNTYDLLLVINEILDLTEKAHKKEVSYKKLKDDPRAYNLSNRITRVQNAIEKLDKTIEDKRNEFIKDLEEYYED